MIRVNEWTGEETIAIKDIVANLNRIYNLDPDLTQKLCFTHFECNHAIRDCEGVQAKCYDDASAENPASMENPKVGFIGALNGLLGIDKNGAGPISAILDKGIIIGFQVSDTAAFARQE